MKIGISKSFQKDALKISDKKLAAQLYSLIEKLEDSVSLHQIVHIKRMKAKGNYFRIRIGNYRLGIKVEKGIIFLLRFMHRKEIYNFFP